MPLRQDVGIGLPPALVGGFLSERQQPLTVTTLDSVEIQEPRDVGRLQAAARQLIPADLSLRPAKSNAYLVGSLPRGGAKTTELGGKAPPPYRRAAGGGHLSAPRCWGELRDQCAMWET